jgi:serine/threonine-protein kinase
VPLTVWLLNEVLKGLDYAHKLRDPETGRPLGIVHRDISPPNILVSWNGEIKLTDFGLAKATTQLESTDPGVVKGKFSYLSPEAAHGRDVDLRTDVFAVGILAFEMLTGRRLFLGENDYQTVELVRNAQVPSLRALNPNVSEELENIVRRALAREPADRYSSAGDFGDDLLGFLFSHGLKFSARDLSDYLNGVRAATPAAQPAGMSNLIIDLIQDELVNFRSLDAEDSPAANGMLPTAGETYDGSAPLAVEDFATTSARFTPLATEHGPPVAPLTDSGPARRAAPVANARVAIPERPRGGSSAGLWILLVLIAAGGGAYYWLVVLGNLEHLDQILP